MSARVDNREYLLIDTPGFNDTWKAFKRSDATILGEIAQVLTLQTQLGVKLVLSQATCYPSRASANKNSEGYTVLIRHKSE